MATHPRISRDANIVFGKPAIKGTRISVEFILERLAAGWSEAEILDNYPHITRDDILACIAYAQLEDVREMLDGRYDDIKSGRVKPIDGEAFFDGLRQREDDLL